MNKPYEFRELCSKNIFPMFKLLNKIGIKEFRSVFDSDAIKLMASNLKKGDESGLNELGMTIVFDIAGIIIEHIPSCEKDIYSFLSSVSNLKVNEIEKLPMSVFMEMIVDLIQKEEFADFFKAVSRLFK